MEAKVVFVLYFGHLCIGVFLVFVAGENWWNIGKLKRLFGSGFFVLDLRFWKTAS